MSEGIYEYTLDVGTEGQLRCTFKNLAGALESPGTVDARVLDPAGDLHELTPTLETEGVFVAPFIPQVGGRHILRYEGTEGLTVAGELIFYARPKDVPDSP